MLWCNYSLKIDSLFYYMMSKNDDISIKIESAQTIDTFIKDINYQQESANNNAIVLRCDVAEYIMYAGDHDSRAIDYFYLLPDQIYSYYESFTLSRFSPHHERLQYISSLIFESGIQQYWKKFDKFEDIPGRIGTNKINNEEYLINFDDLFGVFYLMNFGFICAMLLCLRYFGMIV